MKICCSILGVLLGFGVILSVSWLLSIPSITYAQEPPPPGGIELSPINKDSCYMVTNESTNPGSYTHTFYDELDNPVHSFNDIIPGSASQMHRVTEIFEISSGFTGRVVIQADVLSSASIIPCNPTLPDIEVETLFLSPNEPEVMESTQINVYIRNQGADYTPELGTAEIELKLRDTTTTDEWQWIFPGPISPLPATYPHEFTIEPFLFINPNVNEIEACVKLDDPEIYSSKNCLSDNITIHAPDKPWRACAGTLIGVLDAFIDALPVGKAYKATKEISSLWLSGGSNMAAQCQAEDEKCFNAILFFIVDSAITMAKVTSKQGVFYVLDVGRAVIQQAIDSFECGEYLGIITRLWAENARRKNIEVSAVIAQSPIYIRVIDSNGQQAGFLDNGSIITDIANADVFEHDGDKVILYPGNDTTSVKLTGTGTGTFSLIVSTSRPNSEVHTIRYEDVPVTINTTGEIDITSDQYMLTLDDNGDGTPDRNIQPTEEIRTQIFQIYLPIILKNS